MHWFIVKRIVIAAGGTGGHVFPALCVAQALVQNRYIVEFITDQRGNKYLQNTDGFGITVQHINNTSGFKLYISLVKNIFKGLFTFLFDRPLCVIGFGGYPSFAPVFGAQLLCIKNIIHEQNAIVGGANKVLSILASKIFISFEYTQGLKKSNQIVYTGNPTRYESEYKNVTFPNNEIFTILIFGGSQGAAIFTDIVAKAIAQIFNHFNLKIFQQTRENDINKIKNIYKTNSPNITIRPFFHNISELYKQADLVISRSGASSIFEIIGFKKPSILIPYGKSRNGDQIANAKYLYDKSAAVIFDERYLTTEILSDKIEFLINNKHELSNISNNLAKINVSNSTDKFINNIIKILKS